MSLRPIDEQIAVEEYPGECLMAVGHCARLIAEIINRMSLRRAA